MSIYTSEGLVKHAEKALALKTKYMWGGILRTIEQQYDLLFKMYGSKAGTGYTAERWNELSKLRNKGIYGVDCVGLIKSYYWSGKADGGVGSPKYGAAGFPDVSASYMFKAAKVKGKVKDLPEIPGLILFNTAHPHVGIYVGKGVTIESTLGTRGDGVVKRPLDNFWTDWFKCPYIEYPKEASTKIKKCRLAFPAVVRKEASTSSARLDRLPVDTVVEVVLGSDTTDPKTGFTYVKIKQGWITKSALE